MSSSSFETWKTSDNSFLWLHGIPGCGKTILLSTIIQTVLGQNQGKLKVAVIYFYFDFSDQNKQNVEQLALSLLTQLSFQSRYFSQTLQELYRESDQGKHPPTRNGVAKALTDILSELDSIYLLVDALDEATDSKELCELLRRLKLNTHMHILVTSRKERNLEPLLSRLATDCICIKDVDIQADIQLHVEE